MHVSVSARSAFVLAGPPGVVIFLGAAALSMKTVSGKRSTRTELQRQDVAGTPWETLVETFDMLSESSAALGGALQPREALRKDVAGEILRVALVEKEVHALGFWQLGHLTSRR